LDCLGNTCAFDVTGPFGDIDADLGDSAGTDRASGWRGAAIDGSVNDGAIAERTGPSGGGSATADALGDGVAAGAGGSATGGRGAGSDGGDMAKGTIMVRGDVGSGTPTRGSSRSDGCGGGGGTVGASERAIAAKSGSFSRSIDGWGDGVSLDTTGCCSVTLGSVLTVDTGGADWTTTFG
jgi:hypothetical protein